MEVKSIIKIELNLELASIRLEEEEQLTEDYGNIDEDSVQIK